MIKNGDRQTYRERWLQMASQFDVAPNQLIFLNRFDTEYEWRGVLSMADVLLDTFPYSGCTTVIEALWLGLDVVTMKGEGYHANTGSSAAIAANMDKNVSSGNLDYIHKACNGNGFAQNFDASAPLWDVIQFGKDFHDLLLSIAP
jgi:predicted O-linked N-acetylglucosamine transferase (SPINDLY family)